METILYRSNLKIVFQSGIESKLARINLLVGLIKFFRRYKIKP